MARVIVLAAALVAATGLASAATGGEGGVFRVAGVPDAIDPAITLDGGDALAATCVRLMTNPDTPLPARLVPEAAAAFPTVSRHGKTYTFTIRKGIRFNTGDEVTAQSFAHAIERVLAPATKSPWVQEMQDVAGANAVIKGKAKTTSGVVVRGDKLTVRLTR